MVLVLVAQEDFMELLVCIIVHLTRYSFVMLIFPFRKPQSFNWGLYYFISYTIFSCMLLRGN